MKKSTLILAFFILCQSIGFTQVTTRHILEKAYSLEDIQQSLIPVDQWKPYPKTAQEWQHFVTEPYRNTIIAEAEKVAAQEIPVISGAMGMDYTRTGDRNRYQHASFGRRNMLVQLAIAETIEDKGRFTEAIFNLVWAICEESFWGVPAHIRGLANVEDPSVDLFAAETGAALAVVNYLTGEKLETISPQISKRIYYESKRRLFDPIRQSERYGYLSRTRPVNNWNPWIMSNFILANLLLEKDEPTRATNLRQYMIHLDAYLNSLGEDGGCDEGPSYWFAAGASVFDCLELLHHATQGKVDIYKEPLIQKMASYVYKTHIAGKYFVNFADADPTVNLDGLMLYRFGKALNDPTMTEFGRWAYQHYPRENPIGGFSRMRQLQNLMTIKEMLNRRAIVYNPVEEAWFPDIEVLTARTHSGLFLAAHGGHNAESHNHNDVGDFLLYAGGEPLIIDAGRGNYTARTFSAQRYELWFTRSEYHNLPIINGFGQKSGQEFAAKNVKLQTNDKQVSLSLDIASAYEKDAGVQSWSRTLLLDRQKNQLILTEQYTLNQVKSIQQVFMTVAEVDSSQPGKINLKTPKGKTGFLEYDPDQWSVSLDLPSTEGMEYSSFKTKWDGMAVKRILLTHKEPKMKGKAVFVIRSE